MNDYLYLLIQIQLMASLEKCLVFKSKVVDARKQMIQLARNVLASSDLQLIVHFVIESRTQIDQYINTLSENTKILSLKLEQTVAPVIFQKTGQDKYESQKSMLYLWQIINFICINSQNVQTQLLHIITQLLNATIQFEYCNSINTIKNALISIHNLIAKGIKTQKSYLSYEPFIFQWFSAILSYHFERKDSHNASLYHYFSFEKKQETLTQETQWISYIFKQLFDNRYYQDHGLSLINQIQQKTKSSKIGYFILHMVGNFFQEMIDKRVTTQLVTGFQCQIKDVKQMYDAKTKCLVQFSINRFDLTWICATFRKNMQTYNHLTSKYLKFLTQAQKQLESIQNLMLQWKLVTEYLQEIIHLLNCILFIGGYNSKLQDYIIEYLFEKDNIFLDYFEFSYLLYRNIQSTRYQTKVNLLVEMQREAKRKLFAIANIEIGNLQQIDIKALHLERILANGQLVSLMRLLANIVHINHRAQKPFENDPKYLHMVLSLTHDSVSQATMKEWAIMFIRNVSEWSEKLRQEISSIKVQMKVA